MTKAELREQVLDLAQEAWGRANPEPSFMLTDELREMLDERLRDARENPRDDIPWEVVRARLLTGA